MHLIPNVPRRYCRATRLHIHSDKNPPLKLNEATPAAHPSVGPSCAEVGGYGAAVFFSLNTQPVFSHHAGRLVLVSRLFLLRPLLRPNSPFDAMETARSRNWKTGGAPPTFQRRTGHFGRSERPHGSGCTMLFRGSYHVEKFHSRRRRHCAKCIGTSSIQD